MRKALRKNEIHISSDKYQSNMAESSHMFAVSNPTASLFLTDHRCCFCCQANPGGRESDYSWNMGELEAA